MNFLFHHACNNVIIIQVFLCLIRKWCGGYGCFTCQKQVWPSLRLKMRWSTQEHSNAIPDTGKSMPFICHVMILHLQCSAPIQFATQDTGQCTYLLFVIFLHCTIYRVNPMGYLGYWSMHIFIICHILTLYSVQDQSNGLPRKLVNACICYLSYS